MLLRRATRHRPLARRVSLASCRTRLAGKRAQLQFTCREPTFKEGQFESASRRARYRSGDTQKSDTLRDLNSTARARPFWGSPIADGGGGCPCHGDVSQAARSVREAAFRRPPAPIHGRRESGVTPRVTKPGHEGELAHPGRGTPGLARGYFAPCRLHRGSPTQRLCAQARARFLRADTREPTGPGRAGQRRWKEAGSVLPAPGPRVFLRRVPESGMSPAGEAGAARRGPARTPGAGPGRGPRRDLRGNETAPPGPRAPC